MGKRFLLDERSGIIAIYDSQHRLFHETAGCHADYPWTVCYWSGKQVEHENGSVSWTLDPEVIQKARETCDLLNGIVSDFQEKLEKAEDTLRVAKSSLTEAVLQLEYLHEKFPKTGSGEAVLDRSRAVLRLL